MKKLIALLLVVVLSLSVLAACGNDGDSKSDTTEANASTESTEDVASDGNFVPEELPATSGNLYDYSDLPASDGDLNG